MFMRWMCTKERPYIEGYVYKYLWMGGGGEYALKNSLMQRLYECMK